jgi:hypothetical protein
MINLNRLSNEVLSMPSPSSSNDLNLDFEKRATFLDYQLHLATSSSSVISPKCSNDLRIIDQRPQVAVLWTLTRARVNALRLMTYRSSLNTSEHAKLKPQYVQTLIETAKETVQLCTDTLKNEGHVGRHLRPTFRLITHIAIAFIFLAVAYDPMQYTQSCKEAFHTGFDMLRASTRGMRNLDDESWYSLKNLGQLADEIGLSTSCIDKTILEDGDDAMNVSSGISNQPEQNFHLDTSAIPVIDCAQDIAFWDFDLQTETSNFSWISRE